MNILRELEAKRLLNAIVLIQKMEEKSINNRKIYFEILRTKEILVFLIAIFIKREKFKIFKEVIDFKLNMKEDFVFLNMEYIEKALEMAIEKTENDLLFILVKKLEDQEGMIGLNIFRFIYLFTNESTCLYYLKSWILELASGNQLFTYDFNSVKEFITFAFVIVNQNYNYDSYKNNVLLKFIDFICESYNFKLEDVELEFENNDYFLNFKII